MTRSTTITISFFIAWSGCQAASKQPNILWILTDDHRADSLQCFNKAASGSPYSRLGYVSSPRADRLADEGVLFTRAYCNSPACAPSRGSMHTGRYPFRNGIYGFKPVHERADFCKPTFPVLLRDAGYDTAVVGKSGYYIFGDRTWWTANLYNTEIDMKNDLGAVGLTDFFKTKDPDTDNFYRPDGTVLTLSEGMPAKDREAIEAETDLLLSYCRQGQEIIGGVSLQPAEGTLDGQIEAAFEQWLAQAGRTYAIPSKDKTARNGQKTIHGPDPDKPVFVHIGFSVPHTPVLPPKAFRDAFIAKEKELPYRIPAFSEEELEKLPRQLVDLHTKMNFSSMKQEDKLQAIRDYYAFCAFGDEMVGRAVDAFKAYSKKSGRDWLVVYAIGDHGWHLGEQGIEAKFAPYDRSNHGAVIVASSNKQWVPAGKVFDDFVEYVDFAPTFCQAAGIRSPDYFDGYSLVDTLRGKAPARAYVLAEMDHVYGPRAYLRTRQFAFSMRTRNTGKPGKEVKWALDAPLAEVEPALYDLRTDPDERWNVALDPEYAKLCEWFRTKLGSIVLGDRRIECDWTKDNVYSLSDFAGGADDKKADIPPGLIPPKEVRP